MPTLVSPSQPLCLTLPLYYCIIILSCLFPQMTCLTGPTSPGKVLHKCLWGNGAKKPASSSVGQITHVDFITGTYTVCCSSRRILIPRPAEKMSSPPEDHMSRRSKHSHTDSRYDDSKTTTFIFFFIKVNGLFFCVCAFLNYWLGSNVLICGSHVLSVDSCCQQ